MRASCQKKPSFVCGAHTCFVYSCDFLFSLFPLGWLNGGPQLGVKAGLGDMGDQDQWRVLLQSRTPHKIKSGALPVCKGVSRQFLFFLPFPRRPKSRKRAGNDSTVAGGVHGIRRTGSWLTWRKSAADCCKILNIALFQPGAILGQSGSSLLFRLPPQLQRGEGGESGEIFHEKKTHERGGKE